GATPPTGKPVAARTSSLVATRPSAQSSARHTFSLSIRWRPDATTITGSPSMTNRIDFAIWPTWQPTARAASATVAVDSPSVLSSTCRPSSRAASLTFERMDVPRGCRSDTHCSEGNAGRFGQRLQLSGQVGGELLEVGHRVVVAGQPEVDLAV